MKKSFLGMAALLPIVALTACSDDSGSSPNNTPNDPNGGSLIIDDPNQGLPNNGNNPNLGGDINNPNLGGDVNPNDPNGGNGSDTPVVEVPPIDEGIADSPISDEDLKSDGSENVTTLPFNIKGVAELGPFKNGATVSVSSVNAKTMVETAGAGTGTVSSALGAYSVQGNLSSAIASVEVKGSYLDFSLDETKKATSGIKALTDLRERKTVNVNVLTRLEYDRVQYLVSNMGMNFTAAKERAEKEVLAALGFRSDSTKFEDISLYNRNNAGANLLAISTILLTDHSEAEVEQLLSSIAADIGKDGKWDDEVLRANLADMAYYMDVNYPNSVLSFLNNNVDMQYFKGEVDLFWAAQYNLGSCYSANQGEVKPNGNTNSKYNDKAFICQDSLWAEATPAQIANIAATKEFGACTDARTGEIKESNGNSFICRRSVWKVADEDDLMSAQIATTNGACTNANMGNVATYQGSYFMCLSGAWTKLTATPVDYSKGRAMNKKLGRGMNFGNSWDSPGDGDGAWSNPISDGDFAAVAKQGFNSVRIPVRWYTGMNNKLSGVKADVQLAINAGLTVIVNSHHNQPIYDAAKNGSLSSKLNDFKSEWKQIAQTFDSFPDDAVVFEIFNEPHDMTQDQVNQIMTAGYEAIRSVSKGKTIMFESNGYAKFAMIPKLNLPKDGNIIVTGHYYEPYTFSHQGHGYDCNGNANDGIGSMPGHFSSYYEAIAMAYPDINGGTVPINMGEFGVANKGSCGSISDTKREAWTDAVLAQAEKYGMSWHYWCYKNCGGFEASNGGSWHGNMLNVFKKYMK